MPNKKNDGLTRYERYRLKDVEGYRKKKREWARTKTQREKRTAYMREWREKNREKHNRQSRESQHRNRHKHVLRNREYHLMKNYGLTVDDYNRMVTAQNGRCAICSTDTPARGRLHVDHDHITGKVRQLLCSRCNGALGWYEKYSENIINYLI